MTSARRTGFRGRSRGCASRRSRATRSTSCAATARSTPGRSGDLISSTSALAARLPRRPARPPARSGSARSSATISPPDRRRLGDPRLFLSPGPAADALLFARGVAAARVARWEPGACAESLHPARYAPDALPQGFTLLYAGPLAAEHGLDLLADAVRIARERDARLHLVVAGEGPAIEGSLRRRLGTAVTLLGPLTPDRLAEVYATADLYVSPSTADLYGQSILEAQASGLPVVAVDGGAARHADRQRPRRLSRAADP